MGIPPADLRLSTFGPEWGLPSLSPFATKLATWFRAAGVPYTHVIEDDPRKGPKQKTPWIEYGDVRMGDSELVILHFGERFGIDLDRDLTPLQAATGLTLRRTFETHFHAITEHDLFVSDGGWEAVKPHFHFLPALLRPFVLPIIRSDSRKEAHIRGIGRHTEAERSLLARADLQAASTLLGDGPFVFGDAITTTDCTLFAFLSFVQQTPYDTAAKAHLAELPALGAYVARIRAALWPELHPSHPA